MKQILVIQTAYLGDVILATSILEKMHACYPDSAIDIMVRQGNDSVLYNHPFIRRVLVWDKKKGKYKNLLLLLSKIRKQQYDCVIGVQRFTTMGFMVAFSGATIRIGFSRNIFSFLFTHKVAHTIGKSIEDSVHEIQRNHGLISFLTDSDVALPKLYPHKSDIEEGQPYIKNQPYICIAPASIWFTKQYPLSKWIDFIDQLPPNYTIYLVGSQNDEVLCNHIKTNTHHQRVYNLAGKIPVLAVAALMEQATMNYTNDSAPLHIASAMNAPCTAIFCSTLPSFGFGPLSTNRHIIEVHNVPCRSCGLHGYRQCPKKHFHCGYWIETKALLERLPAKE
ncbi:MAG: glycosyltransferase family 9 protein [Phycisphaerales bacterium]|nr:glycosyltransferase family 9 protein [Phycisphaerales bacterium]